MNWIMLNIPLAALMVGLVAGLPLWVILTQSEEDRPVAIDPAVLRPATVAIPATVASPDPAAGARTELATAQAA